MSTHRQPSGAAWEGGGVSTNMENEHVSAAVDLPGHDALHLWFGLSYASWLTLPRVMMQAMPDAWQRDVARLLGEWDNTWRGEAAGVVAKTRVNRVGARGRIEAWPEWVTNYRHPDGAALDAARGAPPLITLGVGDPRRAAWLQHWRNTGAHDSAIIIERRRLPIDVETDWPPESAGVTSIDYGRRQVWFLPQGTPEWAAHIAARGSADKRKPQFSDAYVHGEIQARSRWPLLVAPAGCVKSENGEDNQP